LAVHLLDAKGDRHLPFYVVCHPTQFKVLLCREFHTTSYRHPLQGSLAVATPMQTNSVQALG
jgi:hypothetical protein